MSDLCDACGQPLPGTERAVDADVVDVGDRHPVTAHLMASKAAPRAGSLRAAFLERLATYADGATDYETPDWFPVNGQPRSHQAISGCRSGLKRDGWVMPLVRDGEVVKRTNEFGNPAIAWTVTQHARDFLTFELGARQIAQASTR